MKLTIMCGLPNSGKTTKATEIAEQTGATLFNFDQFRHNHPMKLNAAIVRNDAIDAVNAELRSGNDVVYDTVNATVAERAYVLEHCAADDVTITCVYMDTPFEVANTRDKSHGLTAMFAKFFEPPTEDEGFDELIVIHTDAPEPEPAQEERIAALEAVIQAQADALTALGVIPDAE